MLAFSTLNRALRALRMRFICTRIASVPQEDKKANFQSRLILSVPDHSFGVFRRFNATTVLAIALGAAKLLAFWCYSYVGMIAIEPVVQSPS
jgi:hypothetical protein